MAVTNYAVHPVDVDLSTSTAESTSRVSKSGLQQLHALSGLCSAAEFDIRTRSLPLSEQTIYGDATDQAILRFSETLGSVSEMRESWNSVFTLGFDSRNKFMIKTFTPAKSESPNLALSTMEASAFRSKDLYVLEATLPSLFLTIRNN